MKSGDMYGHLFLGDIVESKNRPGNYAVITRINPKDKTMPLRLIWIRRKSNGKLSLDRVPYHAPYKHLAERTRTLLDGEKRLLVAELALAGHMLDDLVVGG